MCGTAETVEANTSGSSNGNPWRNEIKVIFFAIVKLNGDVNVNADSKKITLLIEFSKSFIALHKRDVIILHNQNKHFVRTSIESNLSANQRSETIHSNQDESSLRLKYD